jgi:hypothetical protein
MPKEYLKKRMQEEQKAMILLSNDDLKCRDCKFKLDDVVLKLNTTRCLKYRSRKPNNVLLGKGCEKYKKEI